MAKQLNVNLAFTADTGQAKAQIMQLQQQLTNLVNIAGRQSGQLGLTKELQQATTAAAQLKAQLQTATDVNTGKLDLTKFTQSMTESGMSLKKYQQQLSHLGPEGDKAFASLAASINNADARLKNANTMLGQFATTLKNTARWQISSSILHGFMGALQGAYGYAQALNGSLNNIRIVTGQSTDEMAGFAERANKAAQALSTTTTSYTDAALIYYQQGIRDQEEIAARTETTIKLANVSRQSAEEVSQEMTAIWNNFDNGSQNLEYYADVITALGAATASSSQEIATGLEKFAAIANTVGLSYEYATAAMATITAQTRQSADTVGTGLRTLFSRLESLKLGDTLEDGVDLNKYSQALDAVGVKVLDTSGQLRDMDSILNDLGDRWDQLSKAQQVALAQTVGGVRQYTNLIALMDNWDKMQENVLIAEGAEGTLQKQADIYAESWEGAQKRVKAAWEAIYQSILDDKFFIGLANGFAGFLNIIDDAVDGLGGMKGALLLLGSLITKIFNQDLTNGIAKLTSGFQLAMMGGQQYVEQQRQEVNNLLAKTNVENGTLGGANIAASYQAQGDLQNAYLKSAESMTAEQRTIAQLLLDQNKALGENVRLQAEATQETEKEASAMEREVILATKGRNNRAALETAFRDRQGDLQRIGAAQTIDSQLATSMNKVNWSDTANKDQEAIQQVNAALKSLQQGFESVGETAENVLGADLSNVFERLIKYSSEGSVSVKRLKQAWDTWTGKIGDTGQSFDKIVNKLTAIQAQANGIKKGTKEWEDLRAKVEEAARAMSDVGAKAAEGAAGVGTLKAQTEMATEMFNEFQATVSQRLGQGIMAASSALMSFGMALSSIKSLGSIWADEDVSLGDKIISTMTSLGIIIPSVTSALKAENIEKMKSALLNKQEFASLFGLQAMKTKEGTIIWQSIGAKTADTAATTAGAAANLVAASAEEVETAANTGLATAIWGVVKARAGALMGMLPYVAAMLGTVAVVASVIAVIKALSNALHSEEIAAENARKTVEDLTEKSEEAKQAASDLKTTIDTYDSCVEKLENCTKGTKEWRDALRETNRSAIETLNTVGDFLSSEEYQQLVQGFKENGTLDPTILEKAQSRADDAAANMEYATALADYQASQAELTVGIKDLIKEMGSASISDSLSPLDAYDSKYQDVIQNNLADLSSAINTDDLKRKFAQLGIDISNLSDQDLTKLQNGLNSMSDTALKAAEKLGVIAGIKVEDIAGDKYNATEKAYASSQAVNDAQSATKMWQDRAELLAGDQNAQLAIQAQMNYYNEDYYQKMADAMGQILGANVTKAERGSSRNIWAGDKWKEDQGKIFFDVDGKRTGYTPEEVGSMIAASLSESEIKQDLNEARQFLNDASDNMKTFADSAIQNFDTQNKKFDFGQFVGDKTKAELDALEGLTGDQLLKALSLDEDKIASLANMYQMSQDELISQLETDINQGLKDFDIDSYEFTKGLSGSAKKLFKETIGNLGDVTLNEAKSIKQHMDDIYMNNYGDTSKQEAYTNFLESINKNGGDVAKFEESINNIDWKNADVEDLANLLEEAGVESEIFSTQLARMLGIFQSIAPEDTTSPEERYKAVHDITSGLNTGKEITQTEYDTLDQYGLDVENFFSKTASGTYMFTGSVEDLQVALQEGDIALGGFTDKINQLNNEAMALEALQSGKDLSGHQQIVQGKTGEEAVAANADLSAKIGAVNAFSEESGINDRHLARINEEFGKRNEETGEYTGELTADQIKELDQAYQNLRNTLSDEQIEERLKGIKEEQAELNEQKKTSAIADDMDIAKVKEYNDYLKENAQNLDWVEDSLADNEEALLDTAAAWEDAIEGIEAIQKEWKNWNKLGLQTPEVLSEMSDVLSDIFNQDVSQDFVADHLEEIQRLAEGDVSAIDDLGEALAQNTALEAGVKIGMDMDTWNQEVQQVFNDIDAVGLENIKVGAEIQNEGFYDALNEMIVSSEMTEGQVNTLLGGIGYNPKVTMKEVRIENMQDSDSDGHYEMTYSGLNGESGGTVTVDEHFANSHKNGDTITIPVIEGSTFAGRAAGAGNSGRTGGGGGGGCFIAGTLVSTLQGFYPIEQIHKGDIVLSYNEKTQQNEYSSVVDTMIHALWTDIYSIYIGTDILKATGIHPFYVKRAGMAEWLPASELHEGDLLFLASGIWLPIQKIEVKMKLQIVYNFEVSGNHNYYVGKQQILAHNKGGRRGGGRRTERNRAAMKKPDEGKERYHVVKNQLQSIEGQLKKIDTAYNRAFGRDKVKLLNQNIAKQKELIQKQKEYVAEIEKYRAADKAALSSGTTQFWSETDGKMKTVAAGAGNYLGVGLNYDDNGNVTNYDELVEANNAAFNAATKKYNKAKKGDKKAERAYEIAKAQYEGFNELLKQYEDSEDLLVEQQQKLQEEQNKLYDQLLEKTQLIVTLKIDVEDDSLKLLDFLLGRIEEDAYEAANRISLMGQELESSLKKVSAYEEGLSSIFENHGLNGKAEIAKLIAGDYNPEDLKARMEAGGNKISEKEVAYMRELIDGMLAEFKNESEIFAKMTNEIGTIMEANIKKLDRITDRVNHLKNVTASYKDLVDLTGRAYLKMSSNIYDQIEDTNVQLAKNATEMAYLRKKQAEDQLQTVKDGYAAVEGQLTSELKVLWLKRIEEAEDYVTKMTEDYYDTWEEAIEAVNTRFESAMQNMAEEFSRVMAGAAGNLEGLKSRFDLRKQVADVYVPEYEKMYQLTKLIRDAQDKIDETSNVKIKQELQKIQEKILEARESEVQLSQYEIDYMQRELELKAAQLAMEEAANVKSQVRMTRDSEGNYSYVYTADEQAVEEAEASYQDKLYEMQRLNEEYILELQNQILELEDSFINAMQEAADLYGMGTDEYYQAIKNIQKDYQEYFEELTGELDLALENQMETATTHAEVYAQVTGDVYQANVDLTTSWDETTLAILTDIDTLTEYEELWVNATQEAYRIATDISLQWESDIAAIYDAAKSTINDFTDSMITNLDDIQNKGGEATGEISSELDLVQSTIRGVVNEVVNWEIQYVSTVEKLIDKNSKLITSLNDIFKVWSDIAGLAAEEPAASTSKSSGGGKKKRNNRGGGRRTNRSNRGGGRRTTPAPAPRRTTTQYYRNVSTGRNYKIGTGKCFDAGTKITMANGSYKNIEDIYEGEQVLSYNIQTQQFEIQSVISTTIHHNTLNMLDIYLEDGSHLGITNNHPIYTTEGWATEDIETAFITHKETIIPLRIGQLVYGEKALSKIIKIIHRPNIKNYNTYNLGISNTHTYIANGQVVHNIITKAEGGYVGDWAGDVGSLAILHKQEYVLNKEDTKDLFQTVALVRDIANVIDLNSLAMSGGLTNLISPTGISNTTTGLEQNVHITAEFPNATNRNEILAAFDNVINLASQYANR